MYKIIFDRYWKATQALESMEQYIRKFGKVTLEDICDLGVASTMPNYEKYGWRDISSARIEEDTINGVYLILPDPIPLTTDISEEEDKPDMVNHPPHYISESGIEVIDVIKAFTKDLKGFEATDTGNVIKYILRWKHKNGIEDLKKAQWYLNDLITELEKGEE